MLHNGQEARLFSKFNLNDGAALDVMRAVEAALRISLPADYFAFLRGSNEGEGFIGRKYLMHWKAEELKPFNEGYEVQKYAPGLCFLAPAVAERLTRST